MRIRLLIIGLVSCAELMLVLVQAEAAALNPPVVEVEPPELHGAEKFKETMKDLGMFLTTIQTSACSLLSIMLCLAATLALQ